VLIILQNEAEEGLLLMLSELALIVLSFFSFILSLPSNHSKAKEAYFELLLGVVEK